MKLSDIGVIASKENQFNKKGIFTVEDLVRFLPRKYKDLSQVTGILPNDEISCVQAVVEDVNAYNRTKPVLIARCRILPTGESLSVTWFHQNYMYNKIAAMMGCTVFIAGKITWNESFRSFGILSPDLFELDSPEARRIMPVYSSISGMTVNYLSDHIQTALKTDVVTQEVFPRDIIEKYSRLSLLETLRTIHNPESHEALEEAQERLLCDELLTFAAQNEWAHRNNAIGSPFAIKTLKLYNEIIAELPYTLTPDQQSALNAMIEHVKSGKRTNALLQGDVGCGKSILAFLMMAMFVGSGYQAVLMAPTQVLAKQHYEDLVKLFEGKGYKVSYLDTSLKASEKKKMLASIEKGKTQIIVGTNSVISEKVKYAHLAITITDEEHKFGVAQREALVKKASIGVHSITMSATPIPRSLAHVIYGTAMQLYTIKTMPAGRKPVMTGLIKTKEKLFKFILKEARLGHQTYVVCPMIEKNEDFADVKSVEEVSKEYEEWLGPNGVKVETLTGKDTKERTADVLARFKSGEVSVLISTTVIEVGVNVPTATTMVVVNAERFGLAALHQLRGRVGRGSLQSFCVLDSTAANDTAIERLNALVNSNSGFDIAKEDLRIRGAGDFLGTRQSGDNKMLALMLAYPEKYEKMQALAVLLIDEHGWEPEKAKQQ